MATTNPVSGTALYIYTATEQTAARDPLGNVTQSAYDAAGRLTLTTDPSNNTTQYQYDALGNTVAITGGTAGAASSVETRSYDAALGVAVDGSGDAFLIGSTTTPNFPITGTAFQATNRGQADAFVAEIGAGLTGTASLLSSSYLGGSNADYGNAIALDSVGNAYITGKTTSTDFTTLTPYSATNVAGGAYDSFVSRVGTALPRGTIGTVAGVGGAYGYGGDGGRATAAQLSYPIGEPAVDAAGDVFFADTSNERVREVIAASGSITTVVDSGGAGGFGGDGGPASAALVSAPEGVTLDAAGNLYIADTYNSRVREVRAVGGVVGPSSTIVTVAGGGNPADGLGDGGPAGQAGIYYPTGVALDGAGNLYVADRAHYRVREVLAMGGSIGATSVITTVAGTGSVGYNGDGIPATTAMLVDPTGVAVDAAGNLYIADYAGRRVRAVLAAGGGIGPTSLITTVAGTGNAGYNGDNIPAATAQLTEPWGVATDAAGNLYIVDTYGQRVREVGGVGPVSVATTTMAPTSSTRYDGDGHAVSTTDANGHTSLSAYDPLGRLVIQTNPISGTSIMTYSATELQQEQDEQGNVTTYAYDAAGQTTVRSDPISGTTQFAYDSAGNTTSLTDTDTSGNVLQVETPQYDALNRQIADVLTGPGGPVLTGRTAYTRDGQIAQIQQPNGDTTSNTYDTAGELVSRSFTPASGTGSTTYESYGYDAAGDPTTYTDPDGRTTTITYDATSYAMGKLSTGGTTSITTTVGYDSDGNTIVQAAQTSDTGLPGRVQIDTRTATYDTNDRQVSTVDDGLVTVHAYDAQGQVRVGTVMDGQLAVATVLDAEGRATAIGEGTGANGPLLYASNFGYNANDLLQTLTLPGGVQEAFQYDANNWIVSVTALGPSTGGTVTSLNSPYAYGYDALGHLTSATTLSGTDVLSYDGIGRLVAESGPQLVTKAHTVHWTYDNNGNILTATGDSGATDVYTYTPGMANELQQVGTTGDPLTKTVTYGYDALGDINSIANPVGTTNPADPNAINTHITYDSRGRPVQVTYLDSTNGSKVTTITISYNASDQRSHYMITPQGQPTLDTQFQYRNGELGQQQVISDTANGPVTLYTNTYIYGPDGAPLYVIHTQPGHAPARYWYVWDGQGNVTALTDANGTVVDRYAYDQWGELTSNDGANEHVPQQLRYKGYYYDEKISWYWLGGRYYDPETERYLQPGSNAGDGTRSYVYAADDPARRQFAAEAARYQKGTNLGIPKKVYSPRRTTGLPPSVPPGIPPVNAPSQVPGGCATGAMARILRGDIGGQTNVASSIVAGTDPATGIPYDRGHLLGANLGGSNTDPANFVAETVNANRGAMQILENKVRTLARLNYGVLYQVEPAYLIGPVRSVGNLCIPNLVHVTIGRTSITTNPGQPDFYEFNASAAVAPSGQPEFIYGGTLCGVGDFLVPNLVGNTSQATLASRAPIPSSIVPGLGNNVTNRDCTTPTV